MLTITEIDTYYSQAKILHGLSLTLKEGECVALLGRNGAGKSTTMKSIMGMVKPRTGSIEFDGKNITGRRNHRIARMGVGYVPEDRRIFPKLTVRENLSVGKRPNVHLKNPWSVEKVFELFPAMEKFQDRLGGNLSGGEQQMLTLGRTLMGNPRTLLLDEPTEGLAPIIIQNIIDAVKILKSEGISILLSEQNQRSANALCDRAYILEQGRLVFEGSMEELKADRALQEKYLSVR